MNARAVSGAKPVKSRTNRPVAVATAPAEGEPKIRRLAMTLRRHWLWIVANVGAAIPLLWLAWDTAMDNLTVNPIDDFTERTGTATIILLLLTLAVTPIQTITGWRQVGTVRKSLGLWTFAYVTLHLLVFVGLDYAFSLRYILMDGLPQKPYIVVGFLAFLILLPLAITSTRGWMKRLGRNWKRLHRLVYVAGILGVIHYLWVAKVVWGEPLQYAVVLTLLLAARIPWVRARLTNLRRRLPWVRAPARPQSQPARAREV
ncbi:MAG TPA: protein-methionine-sulfoxide reductase heme-binding subunit MsrQ [Caldilineaceae bacterium]|nr:protein-methionine-sulfoxide reductase heme-binding subunit MsrQ [Caldilineaceae bacterium]